MTQEKTAQENSTSGVAPAAPDPRRNARTVIACAAIVASMTGLSFAAVPLYDLFCRTTGFGGTTQRAAQGADTVLDQTISIRFDSNVSDGLHWKFRPEVRETRIKIGENAMMVYVAQNLSDHTTTGTAAFNVTPPQAGQYFVKVACFCFEEQTLAAAKRWTCRSPTTWTRPSPRIPICRACRKSRSRTRSFRPRKPTAPPCPRPRKPLRRLIGHP